MTPWGRNALPRFKPTGFRRIEVSCLGWLAAMACDRGPTPHDALLGPGPLWPIVPIFGPIPEGMDALSVKTSRRQIQIRSVPRATRRLRVWGQHGATWRAGRSRTGSVDLSGRQSAWPIQAQRFGKGGAGVVEVGLRPASRRRGWRRGRASRASRALGLAGRLGVARRASAAVGVGAVVPAKAKCLDVRGVVAQQPTHAGVAGRTAPSVAVAEGGETVENGPGWYTTQNPGVSEA
jgi:hypothetical protein